MYVIDGECLRFHGNKWFFLGGRVCGGRGAGQGKAELWNDDSESAYRWWGVGQVVRLCWGRVRQDHIHCGNPSSWSITATSWPPQILTFPSADHKQDCRGAGIDTSLYLWHNSLFFRLLTICVWECIYMCKDVHIYRCARSHSPMKVWNLSTEKCSEVVLSLSLSCLRVSPSIFPKKNRLWQVQSYAT